MRKKPVTIQEDYYRQTANDYEKMHVNDSDAEQILSLFFLSSIIKLYNIKSILDVGAGTGRTISFVNNEHPEVSIIGIEPVEALREQGYKKGISPTVLIGGDGNELMFNDNQFDLVCEFAVLHHVENPGKVVSEMLRVAKRGIFISDSNNFGQGSYPIRTFKQLLNSFGLWNFYNFIKTKGKKYQISEGDGLFYSYSVFNNLRQIEEKCNEIYFLGTKNSNGNLYKTSPHVALLGLKNKTNF